MVVPRWEVSCSVRRGNGLGHGGVRGRGKRTLTLAFDREVAFDN